MKTCFSERVSAKKKSLTSSQRCPDIPAWLHLLIFLVEYQLTNVTSWQHVFVMCSSCVRHPSARCLQPQLHVRLCISPWMIDVHSWNFVLDLFCWVPLSCCPKLAQRISFLKFRSANGLMSKMFLEPCRRSATLVDSCHLSCYELIYMTCHKYRIVRGGYYCPILQSCLFLWQTMSGWITDPPEIHRDSVSGSNDIALTWISHPKFSLPGETAMERSWCPSELTKSSLDEVWNSAAEGQISSYGYGIWIIFAIWLWVNRPFVGYPIFTHTMLRKLCLLNHIQTLDVEHGRFSSGALFVNPKRAGKWMLIPARTSCFS